MLLFSLGTAVALHGNPCPAGRATMPHGVSSIVVNQGTVAAAARDAANGSVTVALFDSNLQAVAASVTVTQSARRVVRIVAASDGFAIFYEHDTRLLMRQISANGAVEPERTVAINNAASEEGPNFAVAADPSRNGFVVLYPRHATSGLYLRRVNVAGGEDVLEAQVTSDSAPYTVLSVAATATGVAGALWSGASSPLQLSVITHDNTNVTEAAAITGGGPAMIAASTLPAPEHFLVVSVTSPDQIIHKTLVTSSGAEIASPTPVIYPAYSNLTPLSLTWSPPDERFVLLYSSDDGGTTVRVHRSDAAVAQEYTDEAVKGPIAASAAGIAPLDNHYVISDGATQLVPYCPLRVDIERPSLTVPINGALTFIATGEHGVPPYRFQWVFNDNSAIVEGATTTHTFRTAGTTTVTVDVFDLNGNWEQQTLMVRVGPTRRRAVR